MFEEVELVIVEGEEGIGKTVFLSQFANKYPDQAICLFIRPTSRSAYDESYLCQVLSEQIYWVNRGEPLDVTPADLYFLRSQTNILQKIALRRRTIFYFIIDGLMDIPKEDSILYEIILKDLLPIGFKGFRFMLAGDSSIIATYLHKSTSYKTFCLVPFSLDDTMKFMSDLNIQRADAEEIHRMCRRTPGKLASVRRMLKSGQSLQSILDEDPDRLPDFIAIEWREIRPGMTFERALLATVCFAQKLYTTGDIADIHSVDVECLINRIQALSFLYVDPNTAEVAFISEAHRRYAANQLRDLKEDATNLLIDHLLKNADSAMSLTYLPTYYEQAGKLGELINFLTPDHFAMLVERSQSFGTLQQTADLGLKTAAKIPNYEALIRFSMQKSVLSELRGTDIWRSEIEARMALKDYDSALALAHSAILKEDRVRLLTIVARIMHEQGRVPDQELIDQISLLYDQIDKANLGEKAIEMATDLMFTNPDLAIRMVEHGTSTSPDENALDLALARLSISALRSTRNESATSIQAIENVSSRIRDPKVQELTNVGLPANEYLVIEK
jgi:hypothetical protein